MNELSIEEKIGNIFLIIENCTEIWHEQKMANENEWKHKIRMSGSCELSNSLKHFKNRQFTLDITSRDTADNRNKIHV